MKKILLPTDFSDNAWNAITYALQLYKNVKCIKNDIIITNFINDKYCLKPDSNEWLPCISKDIIISTNYKLMSDKELKEPSSFRLINETSSSFSRATRWLDFSVIFKSFLLIITSIAMKMC